MRPFVINVLKLGGKIAFGVGAIGTYWIIYEWAGHK